MISETRLLSTRVEGLSGTVATETKESGVSHRTAISEGQTAYLVFTLSRLLGATGLSVVLRPDGGDGEYTATGEFSAIDMGRDVFIAPLPTLKAGLYYYRADIHTPYGDCTAVLAGNDNRIRFLPKGENPPCTLPLTVSHFRYPQPRWLLGGVIYHIFVDRFFKVGKTVLRSGTHLNPDWDNGIPEYPEYPGAPLANNVFFGGNLDGVTAKLDYIAALGVNCIYLSPIFEAASNHKYDTGDYSKVDRGFGGEAALDRLLLAAKERGIRVILDGVFNHTGDDSLYFNRYGRYNSLGAYQSKDSPYYEWYDFKEFPDRYTAWWDIDILPRIHPDVPSCRSYFLGKKGILASYMRRGIAGFRLDVVDELSDFFVEGIKETIADVDPSAMLYGEVWEDASDKIAYGRRKRYYLGAELDGVMNYPIRTGLISYFRYGDAGPLHYALTDIVNHAPKRVADLQMNLLGTHDTERILTALAGETRGDLPNAVLATKRMSANERERGIRRLILAYLALATVPGIPAIFYGDEAGMEGYSDPFNRLPFPWKNIEKTLFTEYRRIGRARKKYSVYKDGDFRLIALDSAHLVFARTKRDRVYITAISRGPSALRISLQGDCRLLYKTDGTEKRDGEILVPRENGVLFSVKKGTRLTVIKK